MHMSSHTPLQSWQNQLKSGEAIEPNNSNPKGWTILERLEPVGAGWTMGKLVLH